MHIFKPDKICSAKDDNNICIVWVSSKESVWFFWLILSCWLPVLIFETYQHLSNWKRFSLHNVVKMSKVHIIIILTIAKFSVGESSDEIQGTSCLFGLTSKFEDGSNKFKFVLHGILLPIVTLFGLVGNLISIFIFTRREMKASINLIFTGKKLVEFKIHMRQFQILFN